MVGVGIMRWVVGHALTAGLLSLLVACADVPARSQDRHEGYYYPKITSRETYLARAKPLPSADRDARIAFIVGQVAAQRARPHSPRFAMFAKGAQAEKLIIIGLDGTGLATLYRARAVLAQLTALSRNTELFRQLAVDRLFTFFDLAKMLGFQRITISDGATYAHRVDLE